jgi:hypothetical protein
MPSVTLEQANEVKARHEQAWLKRAGVTGVDVGQAGENAVIRVYVQNPGKPHGLPAQVDGVPVEVIGRTFELH